MSVCSHIISWPRGLRVSIRQPVRVEPEGQTNMVKVREEVHSGPPGDCRAGEVGEMREANSGQSGVDGQAFIISPAQCNQLSLKPCPLASLKLLWPPRDS